MKNLVITPPSENEYFSYYGRYISLVKGDDVLKALAAQLDESLKLFSTISEEKAAFRYAEDKWSIKELLGHVIDAERVFAFRALHFARADQNELPGFEQEDYIRNAGFDTCLWTDLIEEFSLVRRANLLMFGNFTAEAWMRSGTASDYEISVRAIVYAIAGHEIHHLNILRERYLGS